MTVTSSSRGWHTVLVNGGWVYADGGKPVDEMRPCKKCGRKPTPEGHDACLGKMDGVVSACCGHGLHGDKIIIMDGDNE